MKKNTNKIFTIILFIVINNNLYSQIVSYDNLSRDELEKAKAEALKNEDYSRAYQINLELNKRKSIDENLNELKSKLIKATKDENYKLAAELKQKIYYTDSIKNKLDKAINEENYILAQKIKDDYINFLNGNKEVTFESKENQISNVTNNNLKSNQKNEYSKAKTIIYTAGLGLDWMFVRFVCETCSQTVIDYDSKTGYFANFGLRYMFNEKNNLSFDPDIGLANVGWTAVNPYSGSSNEYEMNLFNLRTNLTIRGEYQSVFLYRGGLGLDYILSGTNKMPSGTEYNVIEKEILKRTNIGLITGTGIETGKFIQSFFPNKKYSKNYFFEINIDYFLGIKNIEGKKDTDVGEKSFNSHLRLSIKSTF